MANRNPAIIVTVDSGVSEVAYIPEGCETPVIIVDYDSMPVVMYQGEECFILDVNSDGTLNLGWDVTSERDRTAYNVDQEDVEWL